MHVFHMGSALARIKCLSLQSFEDSHIARQGRQEERGNKVTAPSDREPSSSGDSSEAELDDQVHWLGRWL